MRRFHSVLAEFANDPSEVLIASETDRGLFITAMVSAGYRVIAINPMSTARYRERHSTSGAKSDRGDAQTLAAIARLDGLNHRLLEPDSVLADTIKHTARAHQNLIWTRQRQLNQLRSVLREFFPAALATFPELAHSDCLATLAIAPTPAIATKVTSARIAAALRRGGRKRGPDAKAPKIRAALRAEALRAPEQLETAMGSHVLALVAVATELSHQIERLETELDALLNQHPDAEIIRSIPGLGTKLGARLLGEFGDAPERFPDARSRKNYAGTSPITTASGHSHVVIARRTATVDSLTPATNGHSLRSLTVTERERSTTNAAAKATATTVPYEPSRTGSSASPMGVSPTKLSTTSTPPGGTATNSPFDFYPGGMSPPRRNAPTPCEEPRSLPAAPEPHAAVSLSSPTLPSLSPPTRPGRSHLVSPRCATTRSRTPTGTPPGRSSPASHPSPHGADGPSAPPAP